MAKKIKKKSENRLAYEKQVRRIKNFARNIKKRGFSLNVTKVITDTAPDTGRITKQKIEKLKKLTPEILYYKATYTDESGKTIKGSERRKQERQEAAKRGKTTIRKYNAIIANFKARIYLLETDNTTEVVQWLIDYIERLKNEIGVKTLALALQEGVKKGNLLEYKELYKGEYLQYYLEKLLNSLDVGEFERDELLDKLNVELVDTLPYE